MALLAVVQVTTPSVSSRPLLAFLPEIGFAPNATAKAILTSERVFTVAQWQ